MTISDEQTARIVKKLKAQWDALKAKGLCLTCSGKKQVRQVRPLPVRMIECPTCHGDGQYRDSEHVTA